MRERKTEDMITTNGNTCYKCKKDSIEHFFRLLQFETNSDEYNLEFVAISSDCSKFMFGTTVLDFDTLLHDLTPITRKEYEEAFDIVVSYLSDMVNAGE